MGRVQKELNSFSSSTFLVAHTCLSRKFKFDGVVLGLSFRILDGQLRRVPVGKVCILCYCCKVYISFCGENIFSFFF
jgi:hypothetical protein